MPPTGRAGAKSQPKLPRKPRQCKTPAGPGDPINVRQLLDRCVGDRDFLLQIVACFDEQARRDFSRLAECIERGDSSETARAAHSLKGSASNLAATRASAVAAELEQMGRSGDLAAAPAALARLGDELEQCYRQIETIQNTSDTSCALSTGALDANTDCRR